MDQSRCDVLAFSAHPDDADLFCGATLAAWARGGLRVCLVDLSAGELATNGSVEERRSESLAAAAALGVDSPREVLGLPDGGIDHRDAAQLQRVVRTLRTAAPTVVVAPWREDRHPDHRECSELVRAAFFWSGVSRYDQDASVARRPRNLIYYPCHSEAPVTHHVDVEGTIDRWEAAVDCYATQVERGGARRPTHLNRTEFREGLRARRRRWGETAGVKWAEAFVIEGGLALDPRSLVSAVDRIGSEERGDSR